jgi:hypothetical protein
MRDERERLLGDRERAERLAGDCHVTVKEFQSDSETFFALRVLPANCGIYLARSAGLEPATS